MLDDRVLLSLVAERKTNFFDWVELCICNS